MRPLQTDLSIFNKFKFEKPPVGVKFLYFKPEGIQQIDKSLAFCEMIKEAQQRESPFYFTKENEDCFGKISLGMELMSSWGKGGEFGAALEIFQEPRANARIYQYVPSEIDLKICEPLNLGRILTYIAKKEGGVNANRWLLSRS